MSGSSVAHGSQQWWWISTGVGDSVAPPHLLHLTDPIGEMATSVAYGDWSRRAASRLLRAQMSLCPRTLYVASSDFSGAPYSMCR
ncbi:hypothetical protein F2Q68_00015284 [Brassica cretica]|uniref:Uncharacterized protein n=1 Tax=Brassica cretica TaxID=69181 RepID=A0A8S9HR88_BRACR|nr:hypothetical protein F2Q68_00015284 [Brassica cretica]